MYPENLKVKIHVLHAKEFLVHLTYGDINNDEMNKKILNSLESSGLYNDKDYKECPSPVGILRDIEKFGSVCYEMHANKSHGVSFITAAKDTANTALIELNTVMDKEGIKLSPSLRLLQENLERDFAKLNVKSNVGS